MLQFSAYYFVIFIVLYYISFNIEGHRDFTKNAIKCMSLSDVAVLVVPCIGGEFECNIAAGNHRRGEIMGGAVSHSRLCFNIGIRH